MIEDIIDFGSEKKLKEIERLLPLMTSGQLQIILRLIDKHLASQEEVREKSERLEKAQQKALYIDPAELHQPYTI